MWEKENGMRMIVAAIAAMTISTALADELDDAHRQALAGRDTYWPACVRPSGRIFG
jgi:hypothetical protein